MLASTTRNQRKKIAGIIEPFGQHPAQVVVAAELRSTLIRLRDDSSAENTENASEYRLCKSLSADSTKPTRGVQ